MTCDCVLSEIGVSSVECLANWAEGYNTFDLSITAEPRFAQNKAAISRRHLNKMPEKTRFIAPRPF